MLDYSKVVQLLKKEFPQITQEEIDYMISTIPSSMPYPAVKAMVKLTKHLIDNPAKRKLLTKKSADEQIPAFKNSSVCQDASSGTQD